MKLIGPYFNVFCSCPLGVLVLVASWDSGIGQYQTLPVTAPGQHVWVYRVINSLWLPLLGLAVCGKDQAMHLSQFLPALTHDLVC